MGDPVQLDVSLVAFHDPDYSLETDQNGTKHQVELPGFVRVGVMVGDQFMQLGQFKAGNMMDAVQQAGGSGTSQTAPPVVDQGSTAQEPAVSDTAQTAPPVVDQGSTVQQPGDPPPLG